MRDYKIKMAQRAGYPTMIIFDRSTSEQIAEYRLTPGEEKKEIAAMRRTIDRHIAAGGKLGNYQW